MKDKILSFAGMGIKGRSSSDPLITHLSPTNHPLLQKAWKYTTCMILALLLGVGNMWAANEVTLLNTNFTQWKEGAAPTANTGLKESNTYTLTDGTSDVAALVGNGAKLNDTKNTPTATGIEGYNTNKFRMGSSGNYLYITPTGEFYQGGKVRILVSAEQTSEAKILGTVAIGDNNLGSLHGWTAKATCDWQEFDIPATVTGATAQLKITRTDNTMFVWGVIILTNSSSEGAYSVVATSASDAARGTVSAAASKADEGDEVVITASPADGYRVASWAVSGTGASIDPNGNSHSNTTTLTVGSADATVTVTFEAIPTHSVTAATEDALKGSAVAAAVSVAEGATTTITATAVAGYVFDYWTVSGTGATLNDVNANPVTLTMGTANAIVTAYFAEKTCPTSGVLFSLSGVGSGYSHSTANAESEFTNITVSGGRAFGGLAEGGSGAISYNSNKIKFGTGDNYIKLVLECPVANGDLISVSCDADQGLNIGADATNYKHNTSRTQVAMQGTPYTIVSGDGLDGASTLYLWRRNAKGTNVTAITITRPYNISFASAKGTAPSATKGFEVTLEQITGVEGFVHTGWTADKAVKVGNEDKAAGTTLAVDATVTVSADVTFTAVWEEEIAAVDPEQTFAKGTYTIGGAALDLSTLFTSNNTVGIVTYSVKTAGETGATIDGVNFTATAAGEAVVTASQAASNGFNAKSIDATITVSAPVEVDGIKMVEAGALTGNFRTSQSLTPLSGDSKYTITGLDYTKYIKFGSSVSSWSAVAGPSNKYLAFTPTKEKTNFYFYVHNNANSASYINLYLVEEGNTTPSKVQVAVAANENALKEYELNITKNTEVYITAESNNVYFCQVVAVESGNALKQAPEVGYVMNLNKGRLSTASGVATTLEGLTFYLGSGYSIASGSNISIGTKGIHYVSFTIPEGQTRQLQLTTNNTAKYTVSKTLGDDENQITPVSGTAKNFNLTAGTWYINPQGSNVNITNIAFAATPTPLTVTFKDGEDILDEQALFSGDKATALDPAPTKDGYRFVEWRLSGSAYDFDTEVTADIILDAAWQEVVTVTFVPANEEDNFTKQADKGAVLAEGDRPADPEYAGHVFQGWTRNASAEPVVYVNLATETFSEDATLTAVWEVAQNDATISALSYNGNAIDVESAEDVSGVATYTVHLQWGSTIDKDLISVTKSASTATVGTIAYDSDAKKATFTVTAGDDITTAGYAIQFVIDAKRGTSLIKATTNNVVTGLIGGTIDQSYSGNANTRKLNANNYFGVTLANDETFQEGDVFIINITTAADLGKFMVYADAARTVLVEDQGIVYTKPNVADPVVCPTGEMRLVLPAAANGKKSLYLSRENSSTAQWNPTFSYVEVTREMNPAIKSFKIGEAEGTINESAKTISIEVPYGTAVTGLTPTVEAYGNNGATYTPAGATDFTSPVVYTVTDAYNELHTDYTVTVNIAAPSENAYLASLSVAGYTLDFNKETTTYNVVLDYGTTVLPEITFAVEEDGLANAVKVEGGVNGVTTITVTPQAGAGYEKVYTINFSVSTTPKIVIYDGSTMTTIAESGSDVSTGFAWTMVGGNTNGAKDVNATLNGKTYTKGQNVFGSATNNTTRYIEITIPEHYVAKFYLAGATNSKNELRSSYISKEKTGTLDKSIAYVSADQYTGAAMRSDYQLPGTYYYCSDASIRLYELSVQLYPIDYSRSVTEGRYGTICLPNGGVMVGASIYEVAYFGETSKKIFFDEVLNGVMVAGVPYVFLPKEGVSKLAVTYTDAANEGAKEVNGLYGFIGADENAETKVPDDEKCYILQNNQYRQVLAGADARIKSNRAYIILDDIGRTEPALAPGRRRISMGVQSEQVATGLENDGLMNDELVKKVLINGQLFILRGEKMYDATGRLVK